MMEEYDTAQVKKTMVQLKDALVSVMGVASELMLRTKDDRYDCDLAMLYCDIESAIKRIDSITSGACFYE